MRSVLFAVVLIAGIGAAEAALPSCAPMSSVQPEPGSVEWSERLGLERIEAIFSSTTFQCPSVRLCPTNCQTAGSTTVTDTGESSCTDGTHTYHCGAQRTIHILQTSCTQKPCCFDNPACFCPLSCGSQQVWECQ